MKCIKCGHNLPDDSVFCQYCGANVEQIIAEPVERPIEAPTQEMNATEALAGILATQIVEGQKAVEANRGIENQHVYDPEYGFVPHKPIYTSGVDGEKQYLHSLRTVAGSPVTWNRRGSMGADGVHGMIDIYDVYLPSGDLYRTLYINMYSATNSTHPPVGFYIATKPNNAMILDSVTSTRTSNVNHTDKNSKKAKVANKTLRVLSWVIVALVTVSLAVALYQVHNLRSQNAEQLTQIAALQGRINELEATVEKQDKTISSHTKTISNLKPKATTYDNICSSLKFGKIGFAANNFKTNESIIVVRKNEKDRKFTLTANWSRGGSVGVSYSSSAATVSFDKDSWYTSTTMTVKPWSVGATVVTFTNDVNSDTFKILIIVID